MDHRMGAFQRWLEALCEERFIAAHASGYYVPGERFRSLTLGSLQHLSLIHI